MFRNMTVWILEYFLELHFPFFKKVSVFGVTTSFVELLRCIQYSEIHTDQKDSFQIGYFTGFLFLM